MYGTRQIQRDIPLECFLRSPNKFFNVLKFESFAYHVLHKTVFNLHCAVFLAEITSPTCLEKLG